MYEPKLSVVIENSKVFASFNMKSDKIDWMFFFFSFFLIFYFANCLRIIQLINRGLTDHIQIYYVCRSIWVQFTYFVKNLVRLILIHKLNNYQGISKIFSTDLLWCLLDAIVFECNSFILTKIWSGLLWFINWTITKIFQQYFLQTCFVVCAVNLELGNFEK